MKVASGYAASVPPGSSRTAPAVASSQGPCPGWDLRREQATVRMAEMVREDAEAVSEAVHAKRAGEDRPPDAARSRFREWPLWLEQVRGARRSTLRDYRSVLAEPGTGHRRGRGGDAWVHHGDVWQHADQHHHHGGHLAIPALARRGVPIPHGR